jgi:hypothetical protein
MNKKSTIMEKPPGTAERRLPVLSSVLAVLGALGGTGTLEALEIRKAIECGKEPDRKLVLSVERALLVAVMGPRLSEEGEKPDERGFLSAATGALRKLLETRPTRQHVRRVYREFKRAFRGA